MNSFRHLVAPVAVLCLGAGVIGCSSEPKAEQIPAGARMAMQGDQQLVYPAPQDGTVYIYDADDRTLIYSGKVEKGQSITVDPDADTVMIDTRLVLEKDIHAGNRHRIYFQPERDADRVVEERTTIRQERTAGDRLDDRDADTTIRREERRVVTDDGGDVTVKKETTIKSE